MTLLSNSSFFLFTHSCALSAQVTGYTLNDTIEEFFSFYFIVMFICNVGIFPKSSESEILWLDGAKLQ